MGCLMPRSSLAGGLCCAVVAMVTLAVGAALADDVNVCSLVNLIATPERYSGKKIRTYGFATMEFEGHAIFLSKADADHNVLVNSIWLDLTSTSKTIEDLSHLDGAYVIVEGVFDSANRGHLSRQSCSPLDERPRICVRSDA